MKGETLRAIQFADETLMRPLGIVTKRGRRFTPAVQEFIDYLKDKSVAGPPPILTSGCERRVRAPSHCRFIESPPQPGTVECRSPSTRFREEPLPCVLLFPGPQSAPRRACESKSSALPEMDRAKLRVFDRSGEAQVPHLFVGKYLIDGQNWSTRDSGGVENLHPFDGSMCAQFFF